MTTIPRWTDERTATLNELAAGVTSPVSRDNVASFATQLETSSRSVASKLRKLGVEVETASASPKAFSDEQADALVEFVNDHDGEYTYAEIAANFGDGAFTAKQIQGKILSLELTGSVKPTPKAETTKTYSDAEEASVIAAVQAGKYVEDIAAELGRPVPSIRGRALSLLRAGSIDAMPQQRDVKGAAPDAFEALGNVAELTVADIAGKLDKTERGVKTMLTRRGVAAKDYDGKSKAEKAQAAAA